MRGAAVLLSAAASATACSTVGVRTASGVLAAHTNDGGGDVAGNLIRVAARDWSPNATRPVAHGSIPQVSHTFAYFTKPGGYAAMNEKGVGLAESTCSGKLAPGSGMLTIVDLSALVLERTSSAREAVLTAGDLAETHGYADNAESLLVADATELYIFHILPDDTGSGAVWAAQKVADNHTAAVMNAFTIRELDFADANVYLHSKTIKEVATRTGLWSGSGPFDFTSIFSAEEGVKYACGRRMWEAYRMLAPDVKLPAEYGSLVRDRPYPATVPVTGNVTRSSVFAVMRSHYEGTPYDLTQGLAAGPFSSPERWAGGPAEAELGGHWERPISTYRSIVGYVLDLKAAVPSSVGSVLWFAPHAQATSVYTPFAAGVGLVPESFQNASLDTVVRGNAWWGSRYTFNLCQMRWRDMIKDVNQMQEELESVSAALVHACEAHANDTKTLTARYVANADAVVREQWRLVDVLMARYADGYCRGCKGLPHSPGYPTWWLEAVNFTKKPLSAASAIRQCVAKCSKIAGTYGADCVDRCIQ
eukprot:TRINITY_DN24345_c0_g1_i1.p1 TRINITY_DN24345_c0_g1~~TRINITY_DN24345_c0_g1_i1.p1  ORF type:complete len:551 (+),score=140.30 TRINITY_DN24345_c0_g1_i1:55-1653(+)